MNTAKHRIPAWEFKQKQKHTAQSCMIQKFFQLLQHKLDCHLPTNKAKINPLTNSPTLKTNQPLSLAPILPVFRDRTWRPALLLRSSKVSDEPLGADLLWCLILLYLSLCQLLWLSMNEYDWVCQKFYQDKISGINSSFLPPAHLYLPLTHGEREGEEEEEEWRRTSRQFYKKVYLSLLNHSSFFLPLSRPSLKWQCYKIEPAYNTHTHTCFSVILRVVS